MADTHADRPTGSGEKPFDMEPAPRPPALPGEVIVRPTVDEIIDAVATDLTAQAKACVRAFGDFHLALSGGSAPQPLYRRLMYDPAYRDLPWKQTHLWIVDERRVPEDDERSNFAMIRDLLIDHSDIPPSQVHPTRAHEPDADVRYERELRQALAEREAGHDRLDFVLLGMGDDAHTASLFPRSRALREDERFYAANDGPNVTPPDRVTMTFPLLNRARTLAVLVTGEKKRNTIARVARREGGVQDLPVLGLQPVAGELRWYLDEDACPRA